MRIITRIIAILLLASITIGYKTARKTAASALIAPRNIYLYDTLIFVSDSVSGILVYSNANSSRPRLLQSIPIKGNVGMAFKDSILYADSYGSILALHIDTDTTFHVEKRVTGGYGYWNDGMYAYDDINYTGCMCSPVSSDPSVAYDMAPSGGQGGSYAVFAVKDSFLYHVDYSSLTTYDISNPVNPTVISKSYTGWTVETIHPTEKYLFLGTQQGMEVYSLTNPSNPSFISRLQHFRSFDPVVVTDTLAYITLREGWWGNTGSVNVLLSVSIKDINNPRTLDTLALTSPYGLTVSDSLIYVANGSNGYTLVNAANPSQLKIETAWSTPNARDFIWTGSNLYMMGINHLSKYSAANPKSPVELWKLP